MTRFVVGDDRNQSTLFPERLDDYLGEDNPVRAIDAFVDEMDLARLGFGGVEPEATGRPAYHPSTLLEIYVYGYLNRGSFSEVAAGPRHVCSPPKRRRSAPRLACPTSADSVAKVPKRRAPNFPLKDETSYVGRYALRPAAGVSV